MNDKNEFKIKISILHKIMLHVAVVIFMAVGISTYLAVKEESKVLTQGLINTGKHMAMHIASSTESAFWSLNWIFVEKLLQETSECECNEVIFAKVVKPDGEVYLANDKKYYGEKIDSSMFFDQETLLEIFFYKEKQENGILLVRPVTIGKEKWYVFLGLSRQSVNKAINALIIRNIVCGTLILMLATTCSFYLSKSISKPIIDLADYAKAISRGNLNQKIAVNSKDEVGLLGHAFKKMTHNLKAAREEVKESEQRYRTLISTATKAGIGIVVIQNEEKLKGAFKFVNQGIADLSGYSQEELLNMTIKDLAHPDSYDELWELFTQKPSGNLLRNTYRFVGINKKQEKVPIEISTGITEFDGKRALVCYAKDITKKLKIEKQLNNYSENLEKMVEERTAELKNALNDLQNTQSQLLQSEKLASIGQLATGVAHEINNPVGFFKSNLGTLEEYRIGLTRLLESYGILEGVLNIEEKQNEDKSIQKVFNDIQEIKDDIDIDFIKDDYAKVIEESLEGIDRVAKIVADLKDFAHVDKAELEHADINNGIESTLNIVWNELKYKAEVTKDLGELPLVKCYPQRLNQVFTNILVNAAHAINKDKKGEIKISTMSNNGHVEIKISDTGSGIPPEVLPKIFDPFFTTKEVGKGTGLGLNIAYNIIEKHKGTIDVDSKVGEGTTFIIRLQTEPDLIE